MLNTKKLLYILPDLSYIAELLPAKKEYTFSIQSFKQINGEFINEDELIPTSIEKLFTKLEKEEYHLILPDFLFTNTIVNVEGTSKTAVLEHVETKLLPDLNLSQDTHEIETTVLTSFKGNSKVQISAIEKSVLAPLRAMVKKTEVKITAISPLSWSIKAIVSLEPSITVLQLGSNLYAAQHYIGVDQASSYPLDEYDSIVETIKTLKGAEPSIQSVYLASGSLVEEDIKEKLSDTLPIQQLATFKEEDSKMPSYVKFIIESSMRTLSIPDYPVPNFELGKPSDADLESLSETKIEDEKEIKEENELPEPTKKEEVKKEEEIEKVEEVEEDSSSKTVDPATVDLPAPSVVPMIPEVDEQKETMAEDKKNKSTTDEKEEELPSIPEIETTTPEVAKEESSDEVKPLEETEEKSDEIKPLNSSSEVEEVKPVEIAETEDKKEDSEIDLSQFAGKDTDEGNGLAVEDKDTNKSEDGEISPIKKLDKSQKKVIKNSSGVNNMLKMVFITIAVFFITIAIGVGVGLGLLKMSDKQPEEPVATVVEETPTPEPTVEPTPEPVEIVKEDLSILVVNATTKAGYAGKIKTLLVDAEIEDVDAANAKGEYEEGTDYLLMKEENEALQTLLEESTELEFKYSADIDIEDTAEEYDAVIVLGK